MRVKIGDIWYDSEEQPICIQVNEHEQRLIGGIDRAIAPHGMFAVFPNSETTTARWKRSWMTKGMKRVALLLALILIGCSEPPSEPFFPDDPTAEYYWVTAYPAWAAYDLEGTFAGPEYTLTSDSIIYQSEPVRQAWPAEYRSDGKELWLTTPKGEHRFRGTLGTSIAGKIIHKGLNGRYGVIYPITFERVQ